MKFIPEWDQMHPGLVIRYRKMKNKPIEGRVEVGGLPTDLCCAWHKIAKNTSNPEGKLIDCYKCPGFKKGCYDYSPSPSPKTLEG